MSDLGVLRESMSAALGIPRPELSASGQGMDAAAQTYRAGEYFIKVRPSLEGVRFGIEGVLEPLQTASFEGGVLMLYPFVRGTNGFEKPLELRHWRRVGEILRLVHGSGLREGLAREEFAFDRLPVGVVFSGELGAAHEEHRGAIATVFSRIEELASRCRLSDWPLVPCHSDLHVGNILISDRDEVWLIDWDGPRLAPRECDLVFFHDGGIMSKHGLAEEEAFFEGYWRVPMDPLLMTYYRYLRAASDIASFTHEAMNGDEGAVRWLRVQFEPGQILDLAGRSWSRLGLS